MGSRFRERRAELLENPEAITARSNVTATETGVIGQLREDFTDYQVLTVRHTGPSGTAVFNAFVTFVDPEGIGHEWLLPGQVVAAIARHMEALNKRNRKASAKRTFRRAQAKQAAPSDAPPPAPALAIRGLGKPSH